MVAGVGAAWRRRGRLRALCLASLMLLQLADLALAEAPARSPRPQSRAGGGAGQAAFAVSAAALPTTATPGRAAMAPPSRPQGATVAAPPLALAAADPAVAPPALARLRPRPRPGSTAEAVVLADPTAVQPLLPRIRPHPRPGAAQRPAEVVQVAAATVAYAPMTIRPQPRPENLRRLSAVHAAGFRAQPAPEPITGARGALCGDPAIRGTTIPPIRSQVSGCGLRDGVQVTSVDGVRLSQPAEVDCDTARALRRWVTNGVKPAVGKLGGGVVQLQVAGSYACRPRNNQRGNQISEHGRGRAVDISAVTLANGISFSVLKGWSDPQHGRILRAMHKSACGPFGTVLGPRSDGYHEDHLHMDTARHGNGAYCR